MSPPGASSASYSSGLASRRLASYRLDAPTSSSVSRRGRRSSATRRVHHRRSRASAQPCLLRLGLAPRRCRRGSDPTDPDRRGALGCLETASSHGSMPVTRNDDRRASGPEGPSARRPMWLGTRGVRRGSRRAAPGRCRHRHGTSSMHQRGASEPPLLRPRPTGLVSPPKPRFAAPGDHRRSRDRPSPHKSQTGKPFAHRAPSATTIACGLPDTSPRGEPSNRPSTGSAPAAPGLPRVPGARPDLGGGSTRQAGWSIPRPPSAVTSSFSSDEKRTTQRLRATGRDDVATVA